MTHRCRLIAAATLAALTGCASSRPAPSDPEPPAATSSEGTQARLHDIEICVDTLEADAELRAILAACNGLWLSAKCRTAWTSSLSENPGIRGEYVMRSCADAYCDQQTEDLLLCTAPREQVDLLDPDVDWLDAWATFNGVVLNADLGLEPDDPRGGLIARRLLQLVASAGAIDSTTDATDVDET